VSEDHKKTIQQRGRKEAAMNGQIRDMGFSSLVFVTGLVAGVGTGFLLAPRSGEETLGRLRDFTGDAGISAGRLIDDMKGTVNILRAHTKRLVH
jgi:hypothetical protein